MHRIILFFQIVVLLFYSFAQAQTPPIIYVARDATGDYYCDGDKDQVEINQALDFVATNENYTTVFLKGGDTYMIDEPIIIDSNTILTGDQDAVVKLEDNIGWWTHFKPIIGQKNKLEWAAWGHEGDEITNVEIFGFEIDGGLQEEPAGDTFLPLISFYYPSNVSIHDMSLHDSCWDIIRLSSDIGDVAINTNIYNNTIKDSGHEGICFVGVTNFNAYNNQIYSTRTNTGIRLKNTDDFSIYNNIIGNSLGSDSSGYVGILVENPTHELNGQAEIYENTIYGKNGGIHLGGVVNITTYPLDSRRDVHIHHNKIFKTADIATSDGKILAGGIKINGYQHTLIEYNVIEGGTYDAISYEGIMGGSAGYETFVKNNIIINYEGYGINNENPSVHTFISNNNLVYNNALGNYHDTTSDDDIEEAPLFGSSHSTLNHWHHIIACYDPDTETFIIYVDGSEKARKTINDFGNIGVNTYNVLLGSHVGGAHWYNGIEDELAIWNRVLSAGEVADLYNEGNAIDITGSLTDGLQSYLKMENNWNDSSGNAFDSDYSTATFTTEAINGDYAGLFDGTTTVQYPYILDTANGLTISVWVNPAEASDNYQTILSKGSQGHNDHIWLFLKNESVFFELGNGTDRRNLEANIINPWEMDYHVKSTNGRWDGEQWVIDFDNSPCIDNGDPTSDYSNEPTPNGSRVNIGLYGNTTEASKSENTEAISDFLKSGIIVFPNPGHDIIKVPRKYIGLDYEIIATTGAFVKVGKLLKNEIEISKLNTDIYFIRFINKDSGDSNVMKFIKE